MTKSIRPRMIAEKNKNALLILLAVIVIVIGVLFLTNKPVRSEENYCKEYGKQQQRLEALSGNSWPTGLFEDEVGSAAEIAKSIAQVEKVAPEDKSSDLIILKQLYEKVDKDPSSAIDASLSGGEIDRELRDWTRDTCK